MVHLKDYANKLFNETIKQNENYTKEDAMNDAIQNFKKKIKKKIKKITKNQTHELDENGIQKLIHFTCKDKNEIGNPVWRDCLNKYRQMYPDYCIMIHDDEDIYALIDIFDKKNIDIIKSIKIGAVLADIFRYLCIWLFGGYYSDMDCMPIKRIGQLSEKQYHGDKQNNVYIIPKNIKLKNPGYTFYNNPCSNCVLDKKTNKGVSIYKCLGHKYIKPQTRVIVGYEFEKTWGKDLVFGENKHKWTHHNIGICQWFIGAKPQEKLFMTCYKNGIKQLKIMNSKLNINDPNYHLNVISTVGPLFFTKIINEFLEKNNSQKDNIAILPCDYLCCGSGTTVPETKNRFIQHKFTGSWLK